MCLNIFEFISIRTSGVARKSVLYNTISWWWLPDFRRVSDIRRSDVRRGPDFRDIVHTNYWCWPPDFWSLAGCPTLGRPEGSGFPSYSVNNLLVSGCGFPDLGRMPGPWTSGGNRMSEEIGHMLNCREWILCDV